MFNFNSIKSIYRENAYSRLRGLRNAIKIFFAAAFFFGGIVNPVFADTPVTLFESLAGNINITGTAGTLRTANDETNPCSVINSGSMTLSGVPSGSTIVKAYLYWAGTGGDPAGGNPVDYNVTFNGTNITADRTYTASFNIEGTNTHHFFQGVKNVTSFVTGNGTYTFSNLAVQSANVSNGGQYCANQTVLSAFSLVVVYSHPGEPLHVVNIWEGFQQYYGSSITLTPSNFIAPNPMPAEALSARHLVLTWEGDVANSSSLNGYNENMTFCAPAPCTGTALTSANNPLNNQFNSTVTMPPNGPITAQNTTWGVDLDMYDITSRLHAGDTSAQAVYSSGADLVILANQTMSIPNVDVSDLSISKSSNGVFTAGTNGVYTIGVTNNGPSSTSGTITVTDTLPAQFSYVSATGTGWTCGYNAGNRTVTCTRTDVLAMGASVPPITLTVFVGDVTTPSVTNTATVSSGNFDNNSGNNTASVVTTVNAANLSTSTKSWVDLNAGDQDPGDVIRYTITLKESAGVATSNVTVTDNIPANINSFTVVSIPAGATNNSTSGGGANGTGYLNVTGISVPANASVTIVFDVTINNGLAPGTIINNSATVTNPYGFDGAPAAPPLTVSTSSIPGSGNKKLYLYDNNSSPARKLSRTPMAVNSSANVEINKNTTRRWALSPPLQSAVTISSGTIPVQLWLAAYQNYLLNYLYGATVTLLCSGTSVASATLDLNLPNNNPPTLVTFNLARGSSYTCAAGNSWQLDIRNNRNDIWPYEPRIYVYPAPSTNNYSNVNVFSQNVINVDNVQFYNAAYPEGSVLNIVSPGETIRIRATVSDPFGSYDITAARLTLTDPSGTLQLNAVNMTQVYNSNAAVKVYEYTYTVPSDGKPGYWTARVVANEGTEGTITDSGVKAILLGLPSISVVKLADRAAASPGDTITYTVIVANSGNGKASNVRVEDFLSPYVQGGLNSYAGAPFQFTDGSPSSGLTLGTPVYSNNGGSTWTYTPASGAGGAPAGYDGNITNWRIPMSGAMNADGANFTIHYKVRVE